MNFFERDYIRDAKENFINQRGYFRFFYNLIYLLDKSESEELFFDSDHKRVNYLYQIIEFLKKNSPFYFTGFTMGWLELISCNIFISNFLESSSNSQNQKIEERNEKYLSLLIELNLKVFLIKKNFYRYCILKCDRLHNLRLLIHKDFVIFYCVLISAKDELEEQKILICCEHIYF